VVECRRAKEAAQGAAGLIKADPNRWEGYATAAVIEESVGNVNAAKLLYERSISLAPETDKPRLRKALENLQAGVHVMPVCGEKRPYTANSPCAVAPSILNTGSKPGGEHGGDHLEGVVRLKQIVLPDRTIGGWTLVKSSIPARIRSSPMQ
jgi:hypothetical protein